MSYQIEQEVRRIAREEVQNHPMLMSLQTQIINITTSLVPTPENPLLVIIAKYK